MKYINCIFHMIIIYLLLNVIFNYKQRYTKQIKINYWYINIKKVIKKIISIYIYLLIKLYLNIFFIIKIL